MERVTGIGGDPGPFTAWQPFAQDTDYSGWVMDPEGNRIELREPPLA